MFSPRDTEAKRLALRAVPTGAAVLAALALAIGTIFGAGAFLLLKPDLFRAAIGMVYRIYVWAGAHHRGRGCRARRARRRAQAVRLALPTEGRGAR